MKQMTFITFYKLMGREEGAVDAFWDRESKHGHDHGQYFELKTG
jgi:hypothetical protein